MTLEYALKLATNVEGQLAQHCERIQIAGSIRRGCSRVGDIEIVCIPKCNQVDFFGEEDSPCAGFMNFVESLKKVKGSPYGKYTQRLLPKIHDDNKSLLVKLDLFIASKKNWGYVLAIRTGSDQFSHHVLAKGWAKKGYKGMGDHIENKQTDEKVYFAEEKDLFKFINIGWVEPKDRT